MVRVVALVALAVAALLAPIAVYPLFLMKALCFALFAAAFNLLLGYGGLLSFGHAAFFGGAAYVTGHAAKVWGLPTELALLVGMASGALLGVAFGVLASRRLGIYFAMITFALSQLVYFVAVQARFTGGEDGIQAIPRGTLVGLIDLKSSLNMYYFVLFVFVLGMLLIHRIVHSPFGHVLRGVRDNEARAISLGYQTNGFKVMAFTLSGALSGLAGGLKALVFQIATLTDVYWHTSGEVVLMTLLGGLGTLSGPVVGAFLVVGIQNYLAEIGAWVTIIQGGVFVVIVLAFRRGLVGELVPLASRMASRWNRRAEPGPARSRAVQEVGE